MARSIAIGTGLFLVALLVPVLLLSDYQDFELTLVLIYALAIVGLDLVTGYTGQISLGHGAFFAVGAYVTAVLMGSFGVPYWATLPAAAIVSAGIGFLVGFPALRLGGLYLALTTYALAVAAPQLLKYKLLEHWTGGVQGLVLDKPDPPPGVPLDADQWLYAFTLLVAVIVVVAALNITRGRIGRAMRAVRDNPLAAEAMGVDLAAFKTRTFAVSAMFTGLAGGLSAIVVQFVAPDSFSALLSISLFVGLVVGGVGTIGGALFGAIFVEYVPDLSDAVSKAAPAAVYGGLLILCMFLMPAGVWGSLRRLARRRPKISVPS
jgi:branched-chain amino acid transport system permease protein